ncbi:MAG: peptidylprolyl isomerase [Vicinamibacterales bacterium]|jgi:cyclophilin family peptidyl-prolyl cis-trans isomerase
MKTGHLRWVMGMVAVATLVALGSALRAEPQQAAAGNPILVLETAKGTIEIELFPKEAPKTVEHIVTLVKKNFYRGQRFHRAEGSVVQIGDPASRNMTRKAWWGRSNEGPAVGVAEFSKRLTNTRGAVGMAHAGSAEYARTQFYILKRANPELDGKHAVFGRVISGLAVLDKLEVADMLKTATIR